MSTLHRRKTGQANVDLVVAPVVKAVEAVEQSEMLRTRRVANVVLADATEVKVAHGLGRKPKSWWIGRLRSASTAGFVNEVSVDARHLTLQADDYGADITVDVYVI